MHKNYSVLFDTKCVKNFLLLNTLLTLPDHNIPQMLLIKYVLHPASYTADRSLLEKLRVRTQSAHVNHVILRYHTCYTISRLGAQSLDSENVQCNLEIAQTAQNIYAKNTHKWKSSGVIKKKLKN